MKRTKSKKTTTNRTAATPVAPTGPVVCVPAAPETPPTTIEAKIDVGFGNRLFVRGQGAGLSWERGAPLTCIEPSTWRWSARIQDNLTFKLLLNDENWAVGDNLVAKPGARVEVAPRF